MKGINMNKEKTITIPLWEYKFLTQLKKDLIIDMKIEELKREENIKKAMEVKS
jgi:hypothetical protein|tara:strand:+ start:1242 stop:1400 length:159 start_codon:yes stop_codon:yes gene_type:complete